MKRVCEGGLKTPSAPPLPLLDNPLEISKLNHLALRSLQALFEEPQQLFCCRMLRAGDKWTRGETSVRQTLVALLGLRCLHRAGVQHHFDLAAIEKAVFKSLDWVSGIGDLGLLIRYAVLHSPSLLQPIYGRLECDCFPGQDASQSHTECLAWLLAGLAQARLTQPTGLPDFTDLAVETYHNLRANQGDSGIFCSRKPTRSVERFFRGRLGSLSDQASAIYGLSLFAQAFDVEEPLDDAMECAAALCNMQGSGGEWWSLYDSALGQVVGRYPLFSMYQDGILPMAFFALGEATGLEYHKPIQKGLQWVMGSNELAQDLRDPGGVFIWDSIAQKSKKSRFWQMARSLARFPHRVTADDLEICHEARPEHFGWLLSAFGAFGLPR